MLEFENLLFKVEYLHKYQSPEQRPYEHKYRARKLLQEYRHTLSDAALLGIVDYYLGINYIDTEENSIANQHFGRAFTNFMKVPNIHDYYGYILAIYNHMGYLALNQDQNDVGMAILAKAELLGAQPNLSGYKHQGGFPMLEQTYTLTLFYLAQAYTKLGNKDKAAQYCGQTMLRQFRARTYELKDFCVNCISLSEYYSSIGHISQAIYLLQVADSLFVAGKKRKLRATLQMSTGRAMHEFMSYCVGKIKAGEQDDAKVLEWVNQQLVKFDGVECNFVVFHCAKNYDEVKSLFRQSYTLYKKALQYFVLDGYVTEHIQIQQDISQMYKELSLLEKDANNIVALLEKRRDIITPIINEINPKAFQGTFEKLLIEVSEINNEIYEFIYAFNYIDDFQSKNKKLADKMNQAAQLVINGYRQIVKQLELVESQARDQQYYQSIITSQFNIAKALSKIQPKEKQDKVNYLIESLKTYQYLMTFIKNDAKQFDFSQVLNQTSQEYTLCKEMAALLPNRIDKLNYQAQ